VIHSNCDPIPCIISEIKGDIGWKSRFFYTPPAFDAPIRWGLVRIILPRGLVKKVECCGQWSVKMKICSLISSYCTNVTDTRRTDTHDGKKHRTRKRREWTAHSGVSLSKALVTDWRGLIVTVHTHMNWTELLHCLVSSSRARIRSHRPTYASSRVFNVSESSLPTPSVLNLCTRRLRVLYKFTTNIVTDRPWRVRRASRPHFCCAIFLKHHAVAYQRSQVCIARAPLMM